MTWSCGKYYATKQVPIIPNVQTYIIHRYIIRSWTNKYFHRWQKGNYKKNEKIKSFDKKTSWKFLPGHSKNIEIIKMYDKTLICERYTDFPRQHNVC